MTDVEGRRYLDMLAGYSALNFGHGNRRLIEAAKAQLERVTLTSRAFHHDRFAEFCTELAELCGMEMVLPMNTGAEAVETAVKTARKWGYRVKAPDGRARIVVAADNSTAAPTTIVLSPRTRRRGRTGPYTPGSTSSRTGTWRRFGRRSPRTPWQCSWNRSRERRGSSFHRPGIWGPSVS